ncbi:MAG: hypothetical protein JST33_15695 [Actinobacteria bacterium]|nr:hypothetical protein [Actinomycetota bacterium]
MRTSTLRVTALATGVALAAGLGLWSGQRPGPEARAAATSSNASDDGWIPFGPFQKPAVFVDDAGITGPSDIKVPSGGLIRLDAAEFLPEMEGYASDMELESQRYTYAFDGKRPMIVAVIQVAEKLHFRRYVETRHSTYVLGLSAEREPRVLTTWPAYKRGGVHSVSLTRFTDQGVVVVFLTGDLSPGAPTRLDGVDVVRGTDVWWKQNGYPGLDPRTPTFYSAVGPDACATKIEEFRIASGATTSMQDLHGTAAAEPCRRADDGP